MRTTFRTLLATAVVSILTVGCGTSASDEAATSTTTIVSTTEATTTTIAETTTTEATTTTDAETTTTEAPAPPTTPAPVPAASPYDTETCAERELAYLGSPDQFELAARCLYSTWHANDAGLAFNYAEQVVIDELFRYSPTDWEFTGCEDDPEIQGWGWTVCRFREPAAPDAQHGVLIEMTFMAYDDAVVVGAIDFLG